MAGYIIYSLDWEKFQEFVERPTSSQLSALEELLADGFEEYDGGFEEGDPVLGWADEPGGLAQVAARRLVLPDWYGDLSATGRDLWEGVVFGACSDREDIDVGFRVDSDGVYWDVIELAWKELGVVPGQVSGVALSAFGKRPYRYHPATGAKTRVEYDKEEETRRSSLTALNDVLSNFVKDLKQGKADPSQLLGALDQHGGVLEPQKKAFKELLSDEDEDDADSDNDDGDADDWDPMHSMHTPDEVRQMLAELESIDAKMRKTKKKDARRDYEEELLPALKKIAGEGRMLFVQVDT